MCLDDSFDDSECPYCHPEIVSFRTEPQKSGVSKTLQTFIQIDGQIMYVIVELDQYVYDTHYHNGAVTQGSFSCLGNIRDQTSDLQEFQKQAGKMNKLGPVFQRKLQAQFTASSSVQTCP